MNFNWQTFFAITLVTLTLTFFIVRLARPKKPSGCGHDCGCDKPKIQ